MSDKLYPHTTVKIQQPDGSIVCCTNCVGCAFETGIAEAISDLRDEFAMAALTGLLSDWHPAAPTSEAADVAYEIADRMLEARKPRATDDKIAAALADAAQARIAEMKK